MPISTQLGLADESTYATAVTTDHFYPLESENIKPVQVKVESPARRSGLIFQAKTNSLPTYICSEGDIVIPVMNRSLALPLKHMLGTVAKTGPTDTTAYTYTGTVSTLTGKSFTAQTNRPTHDAGTTKPWQFPGGKVASWDFEAVTQDEAKLTLSCNFQGPEDVSTSLASASYGTDLELLSWAHASTALTIGGSPVPCASFKLSGNNGLKTQDSRFGIGEIEPQPNAYREYTFEMVCDFNSTSLYLNRNATTNAGQYPGTIVFTMKAPTLLTGSASTFPSLSFTIPAPRIDDLDINNSDFEPTMQTVSGVVRYDGSNSPVTAVYITADSAL